MPQAMNWKKSKGSNQKINVCTLIHDSPQGEIKREFSKKRRRIRNSMQKSISFEFLDVRLHSRTAI